MDANNENVDQAIETTHDYLVESHRLYVASSNVNDLNVWTDGWWDRWAVLMWKRHRRNLAERLFAAFVRFGWL